VETAGPSPVYRLFLCPETNGFGAFLYVLKRLVSG
jgi:hypothetical protein